LKALKNISGEECIKILCKHFGSYIVRQKGSHVILRKELPEITLGTVVSNHKELKTGTIKGILELAKVNDEEFAAFL
jgi:predicted RNA binding protein YcfA (HicA-like mRNA interferase family)